MRKTKIVCTLGPATDKEGVLREMMLSGMNVARFNFSHGTHSEHKMRLDAVKALREELDLPVVIHDREAHDDIYALIRTVGLPAKGGVMHCFSGDTELAKKMIDSGLYLSIPGVVTFANAASLQAVVRAVRLESLLVETDGPFLAPVPFRGKRNEPEWVLYTAQMIAQLKEVPLCEVARSTTANAIRLFHLPDNASQ